MLSAWVLAWRQPRICQTDLLWACTVFQEIKLCCCKPLWNHLLPQPYCLTLLPSVSNTSVCPPNIYSPFIPKRTPILPRCSLNCTCAWWDSNSQPQWVNHDYIKPLMMASYSLLVTGLDVGECEKPACGLLRQVFLANKERHRERNSFSTSVGHCVYARVSWNYGSHFVIMRGTGLRLVRVKRWKEFGSLINLLSC